MLRACALQDQSGWDKRLPYAEFSYNNSYQASLKMSPFQALYGRSCRTPLQWDQPGEKQVFGPDILLEAEENIKMVRENLKIAQSRQRSYADTRRRELSFEVGDFVYLKVSPIMITVITVLGDFQIHRRTVEGYLLAARIHRWVTAVKAPI